MSSPDALTTKSLASHIVIVDQVYSWNDNVRNLYVQLCQATEHKVNCKYPDYHRSSLLSKPVDTFMYRLFKVAINTNTPIFDMIDWYRVNSNKLYEKLL